MCHSAKVKNHHHNPIEKNLLATTKKKTLNLSFSNGAFL